MELVVDRPIDLHASLLGGQAHRWRREEVAGESGAAPEPDVQSPAARAEPAAGRAGEIWYSGVVRGNLIRIRQASPRRLEFYSAPRPETAVIPLLRRYFRLDDDLDAIHREICRDRRVAAMVERYPGLRILRQEPWECLVAYICSANSNIRRIHQVMERIAESFGSPIDLNGDLDGEPGGDLDGFRRYSFPAPAQLVEAGEAELRRLGLGFRAPYVERATREVVEGSLDLNALAQLPYTSAKERLLECYGIGNKIADCIAIFSLDKLEAFPIDVWVRRALGEWYFPGQKTPPDRELRAWAQQHFGRYAGYAQQYLFHGRRLEKQPPTR